ncbi:MAG: TRAM domain-containing protein [Firmicutes bacterium]|nr:TRAM domain-containing protein [Bacillota bacterium]
MRRTPSRAPGARSPSFPSGLKPAELPSRAEARFGSWWDLLLVRAVLAATAVAACLYFRPFGLQTLQAAVLGLLFSVAVILFEIRLRRASLKRLLGAAVGSVLGILGAYLMNLVLAQTSLELRTRSFLGVAVLLVMFYIGLIVGANKGDMLNLQALGGLFGAERGTKKLYKVLDTSVVIDGRVADIVEAHFVDGTLLVPQFVLRELQLVADSADALKRQRGRRGLEVLQRMQSLSHVQVEIAEDDFPGIQEVDLKLIELAKRYEAKIITNDFNLNKIATLQGIEVLNVNALANALKPVVLPGETMRVFILREGKEYNQGVAYLDDGTMVVVDGARKMINKTIDITVTSVHQTTAGKMIFGRYDERTELPSRSLSTPEGEPNSPRHEARASEYGRRSTSRESASAPAARHSYPEAEGG